MIHPVGDQRNPASTTIKVVVAVAVLICLLVSIELQVGLSAVVDVSASMLIASPVFWASTGQKLTQELMVL